MSEESAQEETFVCRVCGEVRPVSESTKDASRVRGIEERCKKHSKERAAARRADPVDGEKQRTAVREAMRRRRAARKERGESWAVELTAEQRAAKRQQAKLAARAKAYAKLGVTDEDYFRILAEQDGKCAVCKRTKPTHGDERFCFDHNHTTGKPRRLLCRYCNLGIELLGDHPALLRAAALYLEEWGYGDVPGWHELPGPAVRFAKDHVQGKDQADCG